MNDQSAQPCGCDPGAGWTCQRHTSENDRLKHLIRAAITILDSAREQDLLMADDELVNAWLTAAREATR